MTHEEVLQAIRKLANASNKARVWLTVRSQQGMITKMEVQNIELHATHWTSFYMQNGEKRYDKRYRYDNILNIEVKEPKDIYITNYSFKRANA
jgi:hypothetical protein